MSCFVESVKWVLLTDDVKDICIVCII